MVRAQLGQSHSHVIAALALGYCLRLPPVPLQRISQWHCLRCDYDIVDAVLSENNSRKDESRRTISLDNLATKPPASPAWAFVVENVIKSPVQYAVAQYLNN